MCSRVNSHNVSPNKSNNNTIIYTEKIPKRSQNHLLKSSIMFSGKSEVKRKSLAHKKTDFFRSYVLPETESSNKDPTLLEIIANTDTSRCEFGVKLHPIFLKCEPAPTRYIPRVKRRSTLIPQSVLGPKIEGLCMRKGQSDINFPHKKCGSTNNLTFKTRKAMNA